MNGHFAHSRARPHKIFDAAILEKWISKTHPSLFSEWELGELVEWVDFWDWLDQEYPEVMGEFEDYFKEAALSTRAADHMEQIGC